MTTTTSNSPSARNRASSSLEQQSQQAEAPDATTWVENCLGKRLLCTMNDGRQAFGVLTCVDRLNNLILIDCIERRVLKRSDYVDTKNDLNQQQQQQKEEATLVVSRSLPQAMIPGHLLTSIHMAHAEYDQVGAVIGELK